MVQLTENWRSFDFKKIILLYHSVGWTNYTKDEAGLLKAFQNSSYIALAVDGEDLVGLVRSLSDDVSIHYLQDVLVLPNQHKKGIGKKLVESALNKYSHVRTHMLLTDNKENQVQFYKACGYSNLKEFRNGTLNSFIKVKNHAEN